MKKFLFVFSLVFLVAALLTPIAFGADTMIIRYKNGQTQTIDLNNVQSFEFQGNRSGFSDSSSGIYPRRTYTLIVKHTGKCMDVSGVSNANGAGVTQYDCHGGPNQAWTLTEKSGGYYTLIAKHSGKCLDVSGVRTDNGAGITQYDCHNGPNQLWSLTERGGGYYLLKAKHSGKCVDVSGASGGNGAGLIQYDCHAGDNQLWMLR